MSSRFIKRAVSSNFLKKKVLDDFSKAKKKFYFKFYKKDNNNSDNNRDSNYATYNVGKILLRNKNKIINDSLYTSKKKYSKIKIKKECKYFSPIINLHSALAKNIFSKFFDSNRSKNNIHINYNSISSIINNSNINEKKDQIIYSFDQDNKIHQKLNSSDIKQNASLSSPGKSLKGIQTFNEKTTFRHFNGLTKKHKYKYQIKFGKEEENKNDTICLLKDDFQVKNFNLNPTKVIDYLNLNENSDFFRTFSAKKNIISLKKINNYFDINKQINKEDRLEKIKEIYPNVLNIEGQKNRKILNEIDDEIKMPRKKKIKYQCGYYRHHFDIKKRMIKEKNKVEETAKSNVSDSAYKSKLLILSMKIYKRQIKHLEKRNSFKKHLDLPLYNLFLNFS